MTYLSAGNGWSYGWSGLDANHTWTVDEVNVPAGYTRNVASNGDSWTITNTRNSAVPETSVTPQTGDDSGMGLWIGLTAVSILAVAGIWGGKKYSNTATRDEKHR